MKNTLLLLCEGASIDKKTGQWSLFNHIETFTVDDPQKENFSIRGRFTVVSFWAKEDGDENKFFEVKHQFTGPQGEPLIDDSGIDIEVKKESRILKQRFKTNRIPFKGEGIYHLEAFVREKGDDKYEKAARVPIKLAYKK